MSMNELNTQLDYLAETKNLLKTAITDKGQNIEDNTPFRNYVEKVNDISTLSSETADATATAYELLNGRTAYVKGKKITGTLTTSDMTLNGETKFVQDDTVIPLIYHFLSGTLKGNTIYLKKSQIDMSVLADKQYTIVYSERLYKTGDNRASDIRLTIIVFEDNTTQYAINDIGLTISSYMGSDKANMTIYSARYDYDGHSINDFKWSDFTQTTANRWNLSTSDASGLFYIYNTADYKQTTGLTGSYGFKNMNDKYLMYKTKLDGNLSQFYAKSKVNIYTPIDTAKLSTFIGLTPDKLIKGSKVLNVTGTAETGIDTSDATATSDDIVESKTAYVNGEKITGAIDTYSGSSMRTMPGSEVSDNWSNPQGDPQQKYVCFKVKPAYINGSFSMPAVDSKPICFKENSELGVLMSQSSVAEAIGLTADKIVSGNTILSIAGTAKSGIDTSDSTATANDIAKGATAYVNGEKITGTVFTVSNGVLGVTDNKTYYKQGNSKILISGMLNSDTIIRAGAGVEITVDFTDLAKYIGLTPDVLKKDVTIFGITGTYEAEQAAQEQI